MFRDFDVASYNEMQENRESVSKAVKENDNPFFKYS